MTSMFFKDEKMEFINGTLVVTSHLVIVPIFCLLLFVLLLCLSFGSSSYSNCRYSAIVLLLSYPLQIVTLFLPLPFATLPFHLPLFCHHS